MQARPSRPRVRPTHEFARFATRQAMANDLPIYWWHTAVLSEVAHAFDAGRSECPENIACTLRMQVFDVREYLTMLRKWGLVGDGAPLSSLETDWVTLPCACGACESHGLGA